MVLPDKESYHMQKRRMLGQLAMRVGADLSGANLSAANLRRADLTGALYDNGTVWPEGFDPEAAGAVRR